MKNLYLLENVGEREIERISMDGYASVIAFDYESHRLLSSHNIRHQTMDNFLNDDERKRVFQFCFSLWKWYDKLDEHDVTFHNLNLLSIIDRNETHEALMNIVPKIHAVNIAIKEIQPDSIFASSSIYNLFSNSKNKMESIDDSVSVEDSFTHDQINISYEIWKCNIGVKMSRKRYKSLKRNFERLVCSIYGLRKKSNRKKIILIEFNPEASFDLLREIDSQGFQPVLINFRRPAAWSRNSIELLKKSHSLVGIPEDWVDKKTLSEIKEKCDTYLEKIYSIFSKECVLAEIFVFEGVRFDHYMKERFLKVLGDRLEEYVLGMCLAEAVNKSDDVAGIITLNLSGETEKVFSFIPSKSHLILLQHAFSNYTPQISYLDVLDDFDIIKDRIAVWGNTVRDYLIENRSFPKDRIIVAGNPKYDSFVRLEKRKEAKKTILITPRPIINHVEGARIELYEKYERVIDRLLEITHNREDIEIIFKLHPQQSRHNEIIKEYIENKNQKVKIFQFRAINEMLTACDLHVNIAPDNFDASTVILEAMILGRPTINIQLQKTDTEFEFMKDSAVRTISYDSDFKKEIFELVFDEGKSSELIKNAKMHLKRYLANQGSSSKTLITTIRELRRDEM